MLLLLWSLAAVTGHSACKRAECLELMLELQDKNSHQWNDKDQHKRNDKDRQTQKHIFICKFRYKYCEQHIQQATLVGTQ